MVKKMNNIKDRLAWRMEEIAAWTGLSIQFLRKEARLEKLKIRKVGRCVLVLDEDLRMYLRGEK